MALLLYHIFAFASLFSYGLYHLISATRSFFKPSFSRGGAAVAAAGEYSARPYHPLPLPSHRFLRHLPLYLSILSLLLSIILHSLSSSHLLISLQTSASLLLFLLLSFALLLPFPLPSDLLFLLSSLAFALLSSSSSASASSFNISDLQSKCFSLSSTISAASSALSLALALLPKFFALELALASSISLQGLWSLETGLSLYVEGFIPDGCHRLLDVSDASTRCDLEESRLRAAALLDLAFILHTTFIAVVSVVVYAVFAKISGCGGGGGLARRYNGGSYEALPTSSSAGALSDLDHVQMKTIVKNSAQE